MPRVELQLQERVVELLSRLETPLHVVLARLEDHFVELQQFLPIGPLDQGLPGKVRLKDVFGNWHSVAARASPESTPLPVGASVLLVDRDGRCFIAISAPADLITQQQTSRRA